MGFWPREVDEAWSVAAGRDEDSTRCCGRARGRRARRHLPHRRRGASAGGLDAFKQLLGALPVDTGMAFVLVQHLDPSHASMPIDSFLRSLAEARGSKAVGVILSGTGSDRTLGARAMLCRILSLLAPPDLRAETGTLGLALP